MPDKEKVVRGLEACLAIDSSEDENPCMPCPYFFDEMCQHAIKKDALSLLREQEPQETVKPDFWTSVEKMLPEKGKEVLLLFPVKDVLVPDLGAFVDGIWWSTISCNRMTDPVFWAEIPRCPDGYKWYTDMEVNGDAGD